MSNIGIINEIGDMGLGFTDLNEKDQKAYKEGTNPKPADNKSQSSNEKKN